MVRVRLTKIPVCEGNVNAVVEIPDDDSTVLGRGILLDVKDTKVSREQAKINVGPQKVTVQSLNAKNR